MGTNEKKSSKSTLKKVLVSLLLALVVFFGLIIAEKNILQDFEKITVAVAIKDIDSNTEITAKNVDNYFKLINAPKTIESSNYFNDTKDLIGMITLNKLSKNEVISSNILIDKDNMVKDIVSPIEVSIKVSDISQVVGGTLRTGDFINLYNVDKNTGEAMLVATNVYISQAFDSSGLEITQEDIGASAVTLNAIISANDEAYFNKSVSTGVLRISKVEDISKITKYDLSKFNIVIDETVVDGLTLPVQGL